jgi:hypothetical protein
LNIPLSVLFQVGLGNGANNPVALWAPRKNLRRNKQNKK